MSYSVSKKARDDGREVKESVIVQVPVEATFTFWDDDGKHYTITCMLERLVLEGEGEDDSDLDALFSTRDDLRISKPDVDKWFLREVELVPSGLTKSYYTIRREE